MTGPFSGDSRIGILQQALHGLAQRQTAIAGNIANVDTPGYKRQDVDFETSLRASLGMGSAPRLATTDPRHTAVADSGGSLFQAASGAGNGGSRTGRNDGNDVDIDYEMTQLSETQLRYELLAQATSARFSTLHDVATRLI